MGVINVAFIILFGFPQRKKKSVCHFSYYAVLFDLIFFNLWIIASMKDQKLFIYKIYCAPRDE